MLLELLKSQEGFKSQSAITKYQSNLILNSMGKMKNKKRRKTVKEQSIGIKFTLLGQICMKALVNQSESEK